MRHLVDFYDELKAALAIELPAVSVLFGAEHLNRRDGQGSTTASRVVVAEHDESGDTGTFLPPVHIHRAPPDVGINRQIVQIELWGYDGTGPTDRAKQYLALEELRQAVWRNAQAIIRAEYHVTPKGEVPGFYQIKRRALAAPSERVHGKRELWTFWIDFAILELAPTTIEEPDLDVSGELE